MLLFLLASSVIAALIGSYVLRGTQGSIDFQVIYSAETCYLHHLDPYKLGDLERGWLSIGGQLPTDPQSHQIKHLTAFVYPPTLALLAPLALLPLGIAHLLWTAIIIAILTVAGFLMWDVATDYAPSLAFLLICFTLGGSVVLFVSGNPAGVAVGLCLIAAWCVVRERLTAIAVVCMALCVIIKPHDTVLVWLCFLLAGGVCRKRALQALLVGALISAPITLWVWRIAPQWPAELNANLVEVAARGGIDDPRPQAASNRTAGMLINLQAGASLINDDPRFYDTFTYLICGAMLIVWARTTLKFRPASDQLWYALGAVVPLTMLISYHRSYDAKMLLLAVPACAMLWSRKGRTGWLALLTGGAAIVMTGDVSLSILQSLTRDLPVHHSGLSLYTPLVVLAHPVPFILLAMSGFYLWTYVVRVQAELTVLEPGALDLNAGEDT